MDLAKLTALPAREVVFWSGAGVSAEAPTGGPLGAVLTERALAAYFEPNTFSTLQELYERLDVPNAQYRPRLETVLDVAADAHGLDVLADVLSDLSVAPPNRNHAFFAEHLLAGGRHITANFDTCIERAMSSRKQLNGPLHFHGALPDAVGSRELGRLGARLSMIENGLPLDVQAALDAVLFRESTNAVVFVGYSGSDFFDATPYLRSRLSQLRGRQVVWAWHSAAEQTPLFGAQVTTALLLEAHAHGADVVELHCPLPALLTKLGGAWHLPYDSTPVSGSAANWTQQHNPNPDERTTATTRLFGRMGLRTQVIDALETTATASNSDLLLLADAYWGAGRYRQAERIWSHAYSASDPETRAHRNERRAAVAWIRGELRRAERLTWTLLAQDVAGIDGVSPIMRAQLAELYLRITTHMRRLPDTRWLVDRARVQYAQRQLEHLGPDFVWTEGLQLRARLTTAALVPAQARQRGNAEQSEALGESEALHAWLNFQHGALRAEAELAIRNGQLSTVVPAFRYRRLQYLQGEIGALGDAARVPLLPGAETAFTPTETWAGLRKIDLTTWHQVRLGAGFTLKWLTMLVLRRLPAK